MNPDLIASWFLLEEIIQGGGTDEGQTPKYQKTGPGWFFFIYNFVNLLNLSFQDESKIQNDLLFFSTKFYVVISMLCGIIPQVPYQGEIWWTFAVDLINNYNLLYLSKSSYSVLFIITALV